jgi:plastocyanin domain-containing protein
MQELQSILNTLGPATNQQVYSSLDDVPVTYALPPAVDVPINAAGIQEVTLVVTPQGYSPAHFAVKSGVPVRLIFKQLGEVGCGNELLFQWGAGQSAELKLASPSDSQVLEFTPTETGDFRFNCPHLIYVGGMTVQD